MLEQELKLELGIGRVVLGVAGREGFAIPREGEGIDRKEHEEVILAQGVNDGAFVELEANGDGLPFEPLAQGVHPRVDGFWRVLEAAELACLGASRLHTDVVFGIRPVDADEGCKLICR